MAGQSHSDVLCHLVFSTKNRDPFLTTELRGRLFPYAGGVLNNMGCTPLRIGGVENHIHVLLNLSRTETMANVVKELKTSTNSWAREQPGTRTDFKWQAGYGIFSVGSAEKERMIRYIDNQEKHHQTVTFEDEYRELMRLAGVEWDERYVWD